MPRFKVREMVVDALQKKVPYCSQLVFLQTAIKFWGGL